MGSPAGELGRQLAEVFSGAPGPSRSELSVDGLNVAAIRAYISSSLDTIDAGKPLLAEAGRVGPAHVSFERPSSRGGLRFCGSGGLRLEGQAGFASCRADVGVSAGRWCYEVELLTSGIQQLGWCTASTPFTVSEGALKGFPASVPSPEGALAVTLHAAGRPHLHRPSLEHAACCAAGVGDAADSFAYDGRRMLKWNVRSARYGEAPARPSKSPPTPPRRRKVFLMCKLSATSPAAVQSCIFQPLPCRRETNCSRHPLWHCPPARPSVGGWGRHRLLRRLRQGRDQLLSQRRARPRPPPVPPNALPHGRSTAHRSPLSPRPVLAPRRGASGRGLLGPRPAPEAPPARSVPGRVRALPRQLRRPPARLPN